MWRFAFVDLLRRILCTSGLLVMPDIQSQCLLAVVLSVGFATLYRETKPHWDDATSVSAEDNLVQ